MNSERDYWVGHVRGWGTSGQKRRDYCRAHDLDERRFDSWVLRLRPKRGVTPRQVKARAAEGRPAAFMPVVVADEIPAPDRAGAGVIEIAYGGVAIRVGADVDGRALRCVFAALREMA